jgi:hypothetical protein
VWWADSSIKRSLHVFRGNNGRSCVFHDTVHAVSRWRDGNSNCGPRLCLKQKRDIQAYTEGCHRQDGEGGQEQRG